MSPQRVKTYGWLFVAMSASVLANLLLFQSRHDAQSQVVASGGRAMRVGVPAQGGTVDQQADTVRAIQRELKSLHLYPGQIDGKSTPLLHAAIVAWEQAQALPLTGEPSQTMLRDLIVGPSARPAAASDLGVRSGSAAERVIREIRQKLVTLGYAAGQTDGRLTLELIQAIRAFERDNAMPQTGRISAQLMLNLYRGAAAFKGNGG